MSDDDSLTDEEAAALLEGFEASEEASAEQNLEDLDDDATLAMLDDNTLNSEEENADNTKDEEISDVDAAQLLAEMDGTAEDSSTTTEGGDMSDDEAAKLLAEMDSPAPADSSGDMSDDEAAKLLAEMDSPAPADSNSDMSDDEAAKLLAEMDSPAPVTEAEPIDADDEALALLAAAEAEQGDETPSSPDTEPTQNQASEEPEQEVGEIEEFGESQFGSDPEMIKDFVQNADELLDTLDEQILLLEQNPDSKDVIEEIFRAAHTLKGAAGMFAYKAIERLMHRMENYFEQIRKGKLKVTGDAVDVILKAMDVLHALMEGPRENKKTGTKTGPMVSMLEKIVKGIVVNAGAQSDPLPSGGDGSGGAPAKKSKETSTIRVDLQRLDALVNLVGELVIDRTRFVDIEEYLRTEAPQLNISGNMTETVQLFGRHMNEIQDIIMKVRMVPIEHTHLLR